MIILKFLTKTAKPISKEADMSKSYIRVIKFFTIFIIVTSFVLTGCAVTFHAGKPSDVKKIQELEKLAQAREREISELNQTKALLEERLRKEIGEKQVRLEMAERGLVITFVAEVLFDSGKAKIRPEAYESLDKIARVLKENVSDRNINIEGYTDNEPIKYSGWKSNWELSTARATSVLHYLVDEKNIAPQRVAPLGHGEFKPVASNDTPEGRQKNRRVEIIIVPKLSLKPSKGSTAGKDEYVK